MPNKRMGKSHKKKTERFNKSHPEGRKVYSNERKGRHRHVSLLKKVGKLK